jgi:uncharacterized protein (DUF58 family)
MALARTLTAEEAAIGHRHEGRAHSLAAAMPRLVVAARRAAQTVVQGLHGRRRAGTGENFWQFRRYTPGEAAASVDWRRSARDDNLYVREQEWESAHTVWLWIDRSASMNFRSRLAEDAKIERAVVLGLALAEILVRGGERVGLLGLGRPTSRRDVVERLAQSLIAAPAEGADAPPDSEIPALSEAVLIGDFLGPVDGFARALGRISGRGGRGHVLAVADPVEETFPFTGRTELIDPEGETRFTLGRSQDLRADYIARLDAHREALRAAVRPLDWSLAVHRTDRPASEALLALFSRLALRGAGAR